MLIMPIDAEIFFHSISPITPFRRFYSRLSPFAPYAADAISDALFHSDAAAAALLSASPYDAPCFASSSFRHATYAAAICLLRC